LDKGLAAAGFVGIAAQKADIDHAVARGDAVEDEVERLVRAAGFGGNVQLCDDPLAANLDGHVGNELFGVGAVAVKLRVAGAG
jgi:hypothetical protein